MALSRIADLISLRRLVCGWIAVFQMLGVRGKILVDAQGTGIFGHWASGKTLDSRFRGNDRAGTSSLDGRLPASCGPRLDSSQRLGECGRSHFRVVLNLCSQPIAVRQPEELAQTEITVGGDGAATRDDFTDALTRHADFPGEAISRYAHGNEEFLKQQLTGCNGFAFAHGPDLLAAEQPLEEFFARQAEMRCHVVQDVAQRADLERIMGGHRDVVPLRGRKSSGCGCLSGG